MQTLEHSLISQINAKRIVFEMLAEKGEYLFFKAAAALRRSLPDDFEEHFTEQDAANFIMILFAVASIIFAYILYRKGKLSIDAIGWSVVTVGLIIWLYIQYRNDK